VLDAKAPALAASSQVAQMFFKESQKSALQDLAVLTASWNEAEVNLPVVERVLKTLEGLGLDTAQARLAKLKDLESA
jgi:hypothetical protein